VGRLISWIILAPLAVAVVAFSVSNRTLVTVEIWPLPFAWEMPLFLVVLAGVFAGFVIGGLVSWISGGKGRRRARARTRQAESAERELAYLRNKIAAMEDSAAASAKTGLLPPADAA